MSELAWTIAAAIVIALIVVAFFKRAGSNQTHSSSSNRKGTTSRTENIDGKEYSVLTKRLQVVRERRTGKIGFAMERGAERDPSMNAGELVLVPRWIKVQFVRKSDGKAGAAQWRRYEKFEIVGSVDVDFLSRRVGFFKSESLIRYRTDSM